MLGAIYFDNQLCRSTVKVHNEFADDTLFVNFNRILAEKKIPELALMGGHFPAKPPGIFQLAVIFRNAHFFRPLSRLRRQLSQRESQVPRVTHYTKRCIKVRPYPFDKLEFDLPIFLKSHVELLFHLPRYALLILTSISIFY